MFGVTSGGGGGEGAEERPRKGGGWGAIFLFLLGIALGGGGAYYWYGIRMGTEAQSQLKVREERIQALTTDFNTAQQETKRLQTQLDESKKLMAKTPVAPKVMKAGSGVMLYWIDSGNYFRKYVVYQAKGKSNNWDKLNATPLDENFILITKPPKGAWRFSIAALDTEGKETSHSEELSVVFPLKK